MNKNNINTKYYRIVFLLVMFSTLLLWLSGVFRDGQFSEQLDIFFGRFGDFLADFTNVVGYSAQLSPYTNTIYTGLGEKAYPPLTYSVLYLFQGSLTSKNTIRIIIFLICIQSLCFYSCSY